MWLVCQQDFRHVTFRQFSRNGPAMTDPTVTFIIDKPQVLHPDLIWVVDEVTSPLESVSAGTRGLVHYDQP